MRRAGEIGSVPRYALYEEPAARSEPGFVHVETIARRSAPRDWTIRPHAHGDLHQILLIAAGGGEMRAEDQRLRFGGGSLLVVPAGSIHAFRFEAGTRGHVASFADPLLRPLLVDPDVAALMQAARAVQTAIAPLEQAMRGLAAEIARPAASARIAAEAWLHLLLARAARAAAHQASAGTPLGRRAALVERFRSQIEARLDQGWPVTRHARELGVSPSRLRAACVQAVGVAPIRMIDDRLMIEARRLLAHGRAQVAEVGYALGFGDPAYFSRWFRRHGGCPPGAYRARAAEGERLQKS